MLHAISYMALITTNIHAFNFCAAGSFAADWSGIGRPGDVAQTAPGGQGVTILPFWFDIVHI
jgi:hypothetical protein